MFLLKKKQKINDLSLNIKYAINIFKLKKAI
jgi:hypothetical protein